MNQGLSYSEIIQLLANNLLVYFDEVFHSADTIVNDAGEKMPAIGNDDEYISLAPTDQKETIYIRDNGDSQVIDELKIGSCVKSYRMTSPVRIVYFKDHATNQNEIIAHLMQSVLTAHTKLKSVIQNKWKLLKEESSGDYQFGPTSAYFAIDINILWTLVPDDCANDFCVEADNPMTRCLVEQS